MTSKQPSLTYPALWKDASHALHEIATLLGIERHVPRFNRQYRITGVERYTVIRRSLPCVPKS